MIRFVFPLAVLAIVMAGNAYAEGAAGHEFKDIKKFARENAQAQDGGNDMVSTKKVGGLDVSKPIPGPRAPAAIGKAIGSHADDGDEER
jgi:hypothetical protein